MSRLLKQRLASLTDERSQDLQMRLKQLLVQFYHSDIKTISAGTLVIIEVFYRWANF
jgi:hypothetical protein